MLAVKADAGLCWNSGAKAPWYEILNHFLFRNATNHGMLISLSDKPQKVFTSVFILFSSDNVFHKEAVPIV